MTNDWLYRDPADRFKAATSARPTSHAAAPAATPSPQLAPDVIKGVIERSSAATVTDDLAAHVAKHSSLTTDQAKPLVAQALASAPGDTAKQAQTVSQAATAAGLSGQVSLSDPAMLGWLPRVLASALLGAIAILSVVEAAGLPNASWGVSLVMILVGVLSVIGILVLIMGYRSVSISGSTG